MTLQTIDDRTLLTNPSTSSALALVTTETRRRLSKVLARFNSVDLSMLEQKLMDPEEGNGWTQAYTTALRTEYQRYLAMIIVLPNEPLAPSHPIDDYWHAHILDTAAYARDCQLLAGKFIHHFPYFGIRGEDDAAALRAGFELTLALYRAIFEIDIPDVWFAAPQGLATKHPLGGPRKCRPPICGGSSCK